MIAGAAGADPDLDARFMAAALTLGARNRGRTWPNPAVGCLLVKNGVVVGQGWTAARGRPHAEAAALAAAGTAARGATAYVTLEPCAHYGRGSPCADALVAAGVARVVSALEDPDPRVAGAGHSRLRAAGIAVTTGVLAARARRAQAGHIARVTLGRPFVTLKLAISADGFIGHAGSGAVAISGAEAQAYVHRLRADCDAIMVGIGTVLADDPLLTCRLPGLMSRSPLRVVIDPAARLPLASRLIATAGTVPVLAIVAPDADQARRSALAASGVRVVEAAAEPGGRIALGAALEALAGIGLTHVLCEGGARVARALIENNLADAFVVVTAPDPIRAAGVPALAGLDLASAKAGFVADEGRALGRDRLAAFIKRDWL